MFTNTRVFRQRVPGWLGSRVVSVLVSGTKFGTAVGAADVITCIKFFGDWLGGVDSVGVKSCRLPLTRPVAVNTGLALPRSP